MTSNKPPKKYNAAKLGSNKEDSNLTYILGGVAVVAIIALIIIFVVLPGKKSDEALVVDYGTPTAAEVQLMSNGIIRSGNQDVPVTLDIYEDFMCPACAGFEAQYGADVTQAIEDGKIAVRFHMLNFLNKSSASGDYSTRAAAGAQCIADSGNRAAFTAYHSQLFVQGVQPAEGGPTDHSNEDLAALAKAAGADDATVECVSTGANVDAAATSAEFSTNELSKKTGGQVSTPSVFNGGDKIDPSNGAWLTDIIG
ncbi:thioredoxin domain-containing protein [Tomitella biformata]|uniref:DsbA family protein n=1 Tax=Tomitella biformata TaxID=630403 RepID=UPI0004655C9B|nr:thioredoxin domain-containing protein [Tomitella biformata]